MYFTNVGLTIILLDYKYILIRLHHRYPTLPRIVDGRHLAMRQCGASAAIVARRRWMRVFGLHPMLGILLLRSGVSGSIVGLLVWGWTVGHDMSRQVAWWHLVARAAGHFDGLGDSGMDLHLSSCGVTNGTLMNVHPPLTMKYARLSPVVRPTGGNLRQWIIACLTIGPGKNPPVTLAMMMHASTVTSSEARHGTACASRLEHQRKL